MLTTLIIFAGIYFILRFAMGLTHLILDLTLVGLVVWVVMKLT